MALDKPDGAVVAEREILGDVVVTFWGRPRRRTAQVWLHQCGSVADAVSAQGFEAGGHLRGMLPALELLERVKTALPAGYPVLVAGGIAERKDVVQALEAVAGAAVAGARFLLSAESRAHPGSRHRLLEAGDTILTELFGASWPPPHRVVANAATERWLGRNPRGPLPNRILNRLLAPGARYMPPDPQARIIKAQRPSGRVLTPAPPTDDGPPNLLDAGALYAGATVARITEVRPAADLLRALVP